MNSYRNMDPDDAAAAYAEEMGKEADRDDAINEIVEDDERLLALFDDDDILELINEADDDEIYYGFAACLSMIDAAPCVPNSMIWFVKFNTGLHKTPFRIFLEGEYSGSEVGCVISTAIRTPYQDRKHWDRGVRAVLNAIYELATEACKESDAAYELASEQLDREIAANKEEAELAKAEAKGLI